MGVLVSIKKEVKKIKNETEANISNDRNHTGDSADDAEC